MPAERHSSTGVITAALGFDAEGWRSSAFLLGQVAVDASGGPTCAVRFGSFTPDRTPAVAGSPPLSFSLRTFLSGNGLFLGSFDDGFSQRLDLKLGD